MELSLVIPVFNQGRFLPETFRALRSEFSGLDIEVIVVDDGSTRDQELFEGANTLITFQKNQGKGAAVKEGVLASKGKVVLFTDADLSYSTEFLAKLYEVVAQGQADIAVGARERSKAGGAIRRMGSHFARRLTKSWVLGREVDTQCGAKAFSGQIGKKIFEKIQIKRFAFDVEIFCIAKEMGLSVVELTTLFESRPSSSIHLARDGIRFVGDLRKIKRNLKRGLYG